MGEKELKPYAKILHEIRDTSRRNVAPIDPPDRDDPFHVWLPKWRMTLASYSDIMCAFSTLERRKGFMRKLMYRAGLIQSKFEEARVRSPIMCSAAGTIQETDFPKFVYIDYCVVIDALTEFIAEQNGIAKDSVALFVYKFFGVSLARYNYSNAFLVICALSIFGMLADMTPKTKHSRGTYAVSFRENNWFLYRVFSSFSTKGNVPYCIRGVPFYGSSFLNCGVGEKMVSEFAALVLRGDKLLLDTGKEGLERVRRDRMKDVIYAMSCGPISKSDMQNILEKRKKS